MRLRRRARKTKSPTATTGDINDNYDDSNNNNNNNYYYYNLR